MARTLHQRYQYGRRVSSRQIDEANFNTGKALVADEEITIWSTTVPADKLYVWGYGSQNKESSDVNHSYAEFLASGAGSGTDGDVIRDADVVVAITDSTGEDTLAKTTLRQSAGKLADAKAELPTEQPLFPEHAPAASQDRRLELRLRAGSGAAGKQVASDSDVDLGYGRVG